MEFSRMMHSTLNRTEPHSFSPVRSRFSGLNPAFAAAFAAAVLLAATIGARAQDAGAAPADSSPAAAAPAPGQAKPDIAVSNQKPAKKRKSAPADDKKADKVVASKATKKVEKTVKKDNSLVGVDASLPDKALYDKAEDAIKHGHFDVGRLDLQALLNTYTESQYMMRAKLAIADSWYQEGGTAALTQAEQEYTDFITFFPNAPEAAEAQMRIGDIYYRQMDKPDRDNVNTVKAEAAYRQMLQQFPDSILVPQAKQKLREVQEALASGEDEVAGFYVTRSNLSAAIARYQTVVDSYPLYSHMDDVLIALGDAYETEAKFVRIQRLQEDAKGRLEKLFDDQAYAMYSKVVTEHSAAPHVEDARDRILAMNRPVPKPTPEQAAASEALENSRGQYTLSKRATLLFLHQADTVPAATVGDPPLEDAKPTIAPAISRQTVADYMSAMNPAAAPRSGTPIPAAAASAAGGAAAPAAPPMLQDVPSVTEATPAGSSTGSSGGTSMGIEIVQPTPGSAAGPAPATSPLTAPATPPAFPGTATPSPDAAAPAATPPAALPPADANGGIGPVGPPNQAPLPPVERPAVAPNAINDVTPGSQPPAQTAPADGKNPKAPCDKSDQSCSTHKPKKGLGKLNPF
jgi:outer membrane protein assembly factor BamD